MALEKAVIPVSFAGGLDTKTDPLQVIPGKLLLLENAKFQTAKKLRKIPGDVALSKDTIGDSDNIENAVQLASFKDELILNDGAFLYSYSPDSLAWSNKGQTFTVSMDNTPVVRNNYAQTTQDSSTHPTGLQVFAWEDTQGGIRYSVVDNSTKLQIVSNQPVFPTGESPRCVSIGNFLLVVFFDSVANRLAYKSINVRSPAEISSVIEIATDVDAVNPNFDALSMNNKVYFAYNNNAAGITTVYLTQFLAQSLSRTEAGETASVTLSLFGDASFNLWIAYYNGTELKYFIKTSALPLTNVVNPTTLETIASVRNVTGTVSGTVGTFFYEISATLPYNHHIKSVTGTTSGTVGTPGGVIRSLGLASKAFIYGVNSFFLAVYEGPLQPTYFLINQDGVQALKLSPLTAGGLTARSVLPQVNVISSGQYQISYLQQDFFATVSGVNFFLTGVMQATIDFNPENIQSIDIGNTLLTNGGFLSMYDGVSSVELGYNVFPEQVTITPHMSAGGLSSGTYQWSSVYAWTDNYGQIHRSAPSIPVSHTFSGGSPYTFTSTFSSGATILVVSSASGLFVGQTITDSTTGTNIAAGTTITSIAGTVITISIPTQGNSNMGGDTLQTLDVYSADVVSSTLRITAKKPPLRSNAWIEFYRTQANQNIFYLTSGITTPVYNDITVDTETFTDTNSDEFIIGNIQLYTTGGAIENIAPPAAKLIWQYKNRAVVVPYENPNSWWYSQEVVPGSPVEFNDTFINNMDQRGGPITAGVQMDDKNIFFKGPSDVFYVVGDGPASNGTNNDFSQPQRIPTGAGCINPKSVLLAPQGIFYQSMKGFYLLNRALEASYIGAEVEAFNSSNATSGQLILNDNEVRFTLDSGTMLMYDYFFSQWTTIPNVAGIDAAIFQDKFCYVQSDGTVLQETPGIWTHNGNIRRIKLTTSWLSMAALQGFQRVYKMAVLGEYISPHMLKCNVAINFNPNYIQEDYINAGILLGAPAYGSSSPYGAPYTSPYGAPDQTYQWLLSLAQQKCQSLQITLEEIPVTPYGEGLSLSAISLEVGGKKGIFRVQADHSF